jgi:lysophospholipase L1-like esterase
MLECLIIGDSIGVGVSQVRKECSAIVKSGINSSTWKNTNINKLQPAKVLIISLGANDIKSHNTEDNVRQIRAAAKADKVYWILPNDNLKPKAVSDVTKVASDFGDIIIERPKTDMSADNVHPTGKGYRKLAEKTK